MAIDWQHFTPWQSILGGSLIGIAASLLLLICGRIAGISGVFGRLLANPSSDERQWRLLFLSGVVIAPMSYSLFQTPTIIINSSYLVILISGFLVGFGTRLGNGCTSGHGVCGLSRLSLRSFVATLTFVGFGFLTVWLSRHCLH